MAGASTPQMAASVSDSGGLGSLGLGAMDVEVARQAIRDTKALTNRAFNVNFFCHQPATDDAETQSAWLRTLEPHFSDFDATPPEQLSAIYQTFTNNSAMTRMLVEEHPAVVSFHFGLPTTEQISTLKAIGCVLLSSATNLHEAQMAEDAGIDAVIAQGWEAGGHRGCFDENAPDDCLGTAVLTRLLVQNLNIPVISAGGIMDGTGIKAALDLGAVAAQLGTAFVACTESAANADYLKALAGEGGRNTVMTRAISGRPARCVENRFTTLGAKVDSSEIPQYPIAYDAGKALNAAATAGNESGYAAHWAGQGAPLFRQMLAAELMAALQKEMAG